jgi:hypothetical protein
MAEPTLQKLKPPRKITELLVVEVINILQVPVERVKESYQSKTPSVNAASEVTAAGVSEPQKGKTVYQQDQVLLPTSSLQWRS